MSLDLITNVDGPFVDKSFLGLPNTVPRPNILYRFVKE
jgi:hypothetical protein